MNYDLIVAGAGPSGSSAAITAARLGARVLLLEQGHFPRQKVCGEFVSAESLELLRRLLANDREGRAMMERAPVIERARMFPDATAIEFPVAASASIPRYEMDAALWRAAQQAGVDCRDGVQVEGIHRGDTFEVLAGGTVFEPAAAIATTGRWSKLRQPTPKKKAKTLIGLKAHFCEANGPLSTDLYFLRGGYCGVQFVDRDTVNVCALVEAKVATQLGQLFGLNDALAVRAQAWTPATEPVSTAPLIFAEPEPEHDGVLFAGDTAGFIDPFAGDGISLALRTGAAAAQAAMHVVSGRISVQEAARQYRLRYTRQFSPAFRAAAQARWVLGCPRPLPKLALQFLKFPPVARAVFAGTRGLHAA